MLNPGKIRESSNPQTSHRTRDWSNRETGTNRVSAVEPNSADPSKTARKELNALWRDLVQKQRIHEMVKCLQAEKRKLKILHSNVDGNQDEFLDFAAQQWANTRLTGADLGIPHDNSISSDGKKDRKSGGSGAPADDEKGSLSRRASQAGSDSFARFGASASSTKLQRSMSSRSTGSVGRRQNAAAEVLVRKNKMTDQEFEDIVNLCEDKTEQKALREAYEQKKAREKYLHGANEKRVMLYNFINSAAFTNFMLVTIITSIIGIFMMTFESIAIRYAWPLIVLDSCIMGIFLVEAILKIMIYKADYFKQLWNILDLLIIAVHFTEVLMELCTRTFALNPDLNDVIALKFLKSLRALRLLRVIKFLPNLQVIVATVFQSMMSIGSIAVLMLLFIFVFAVMGRGLFYERLPQKFGNLWLAFVTLFQLLTLDDWFELLESDDSLADEEEYEEVIEEVDVSGYWLMFIYLFAYLVIEFFVFLNLFVAVLVDNFQLTLADVEIQKQKEAEEELEAQRKFEDMKKDLFDPTITEEEHQRHLTEVQELGMYVDEYFPVDKDSKEAEYLAEFYKDLNSLDFEKFLWKRRFTVFNMLIDTGLEDRLNATLSPDVTASTDEDEDNNEDDEGGGSGGPSSKHEIEVEVGPGEEQRRRRSKRKTLELAGSMLKRVSILKREYLPSRYSIPEDEMEGMASTGEIIGQKGGATAQKK